MAWSLFKKVTPQDTQAQSAGAGETAFVAPPPFFNVMPKAKKYSALPKVEAEKPLAPPAPVQPYSTGPVVASTVDPVAPPTVAASSRAPLVPEFQKKVKQRRGVPPRAVQVFGVMFAAILALAAIWYAFDTFGSTIQIPESVKNLWSKIPPIADKDPNTSSAAPESENPPVAPVPVYKTSNEWRVAHFGAEDCDNCGDSSDGDNDGLANLEEYENKTVPTRADTDGDGIADGDEVHVFGCKPLDAHSSGNEKYTDADDIKGGWDCSKTGSDTKLTETRKGDILSRAGQFGFHAPTITTLGDAILQYQSSTQGSGVPIITPAGVEVGPEAMLDRDVQRLNTMRKIGAALIGYKEVIGTFPATQNFDDVISKIKPYIAVATNSQDPINQAPFVYTYEAGEGGTSFVLTYASETQKQRIRYSSEQAVKDLGAEDMEQRDIQRREDLERLRSALLIYSAASSDSSQAFVFPTKSEYAQKVSPQYIQSVPKDPKTNKDYEYEVSSDRSSFTLKSLFEKPIQGTSGYLCNQEECRSY